MSQCTNCGATVSRTDEYCTYCGTANPNYQPMVVEIPKPAPQAPAPKPVEKPVEKPAPQQPVAEEAPAKKKSRTGCFWPGALLLVCGILTAGYFIGSASLEETEERYGAETIALCDPIRGGDASLANMPGDVSYPLQIVVFRNEQRFLGSLHRDLRDEWRAEDRSELDVVVCVGNKQRHLIEACPYEDFDGDDIMIRRYQLSNEVVLFNPRTTERIASIDVRGSLPDACPETVASDDRSGWNIVGREMSFADFETALMPYVTGDNRK